MTKREILMGAIDAAQTIWKCPTSEKGHVELVILTADSAKALVDAAKLAVALIDRATTSDVEKALGE